MCLFLNGRMPDCPLPSEDLPQLKKPDSLHKEMEELHKSKDRFVSDLNKTWLFRVIKRIKNTKITFK